MREKDSKTKSAAIEMTKVCDENDRREVFQKEQKPTKKHTSQLACFSHEKLKRVLTIPQFIHARFFLQRERRSEKKHTSIASLSFVIIV